MANLYRPEIKYFREDNLKPAPMRERVQRRKDALTQGQRLMLEQARKWREEDRAWGVEIFEGNQVSSSEAF